MKWKAWLLSLIESLRREKLDRQKIAEAAYGALTSYHGKILLAYLLQEIFYDVTEPRGLTPQECGFNEGQRATVKHLLDLMNEHANPPQETKVEA